MESLQLHHQVQVKICGITTARHAQFCEENGADAIGLVFYPKSPRFVEANNAKKICRSVSNSFDKIGVFVNLSFEKIMDTVKKCELTGIQLHGNEDPELVLHLKQTGYSVIKALYTKDNPSIKRAKEYNAHAYLVECSKGTLPGGNAMTWNFHEAMDFGIQHPLVLAGGLDVNNVEKAITESVPDAIDVSSGVEEKPGMKDEKKILDFIQIAKQTNFLLNRNPRRIFNGSGSTST